jgi:hypothetical protein
MEIPIFFWWDGGINNLQVQNSEMDKYLIGQFSQPIFNS